MGLTHEANPVRVNASAITREVGHADGSATVSLADGRNVFLNTTMTARHKPVIGDYIVTQEDGYVYVNPKEVFERKYRSL